MPIARIMGSSYPQSKFSHLLPVLGKGNTHAEGPGDSIIQVLCVFFCTTPVARSTEFYYIEWGM